MSTSLKSMTGDLAKKCLQNIDDQTKKTHRQSNEDKKYPG
jgi:hypothetical protein